MLAETGWRVVGAECVGREGEWRVVGGECVGREKNELGLEATLKCERN